MLVCLYLVPKIQYGFKLYYAVTGLALHKYVNMKCKLYILKTVEEIQQWTWSQKIWLIKVHNLR